MPAVYLESPPFVSVGEEPIRLNLLYALVSASDDVEVIDLSLSLNLAYRLSAFCISLYGIALQLAPPDFEVVW